MTILTPGTIFEYIEGDSGQHEVVRVTPCSAIVRPLRKKHEVITDKITGEVVAEFDRSPAVSTISNRSMVRVVGQQAPQGKKGRNPKLVQYGF